MAEEIPALAQTFLVINDQVYFLEKIITTIGRGLDNDIVLKSLNISRRHAQIRYELGKCVLYDMNSTLGTFVKDQRINRIVLKSGDVFRMANIRVLFVQNIKELEDESASVTSELKDPGLSGEDDE
ncbi:MAG: FHA domain-containing protein [Anaerolineales bacterium]|nr:FHA domain-containing protein [Anaerolineales bacterium]